MLQRDTFTPSAWIQVKPLPEDDDQNYRLLGSYMADKLLPVATGSLALIVARADAHANAWVVLTEDGHVGWLWENEMVLVSSAVSDL